ncbi:MBOAT family protein [Conexibacter sp. CPCC 206217]|uniref:MBOAT family O-acyltransferase n=1 Tax=Conexibacter sp. CPCC 206217 TaxID=3064574 RepID=UPI002715C86B|nr:MBOAT family protein [Conexibacter sp. CPCC 206217]MDO8212366.1 MBOAT family protein [Conexibacter sp. CPCC 206217]
MLFPTVEFAIFFPIVLALSWWLMPRQGLWKPFIVLASYAFYAGANWKFCLLLALVTGWNQLGAVLLHRTDDDARRNWIVRVAVAGDLLLLGVFKYYAFFVQDVGDALDAIRLGMPLPLLTIALPVGVSFFTFQAISYVVDVRRREIVPSSTLDVAIYLSFFPHLVAGPIVRAREFLPQLARPRDPSKVAVGSGLALIALGLVKKVALADFLARTVVDPVFSVPEAYGALDVLLASYAYAAQIYCDFSGYTDIAIGLALLMGFVFPQNFDSPYRSLSLREFWRRWHMTLSRFLRDFLYIPLGGNRGGRWKTYRNLLLTMVLGGLWHGAAWTFVLWGAFHGVGLVAEHAIGRRIERVPRWLRWLLTFHLVVFAWILFRAQGLDVVGALLHQLTVFSAPTLWSATAVGVVVLVVGLQLLPPRWIEATQVRIERLNPLVLAAGVAVVIVFVMATVPSQGVPPFIYFQF